MRVCRLGGVSRGGGRELINRRSACDGDGGMCRGEI